MPKVGDVGIKPATVAQLSMPEAKERLALAVEDLFRLLPEQRKKILKGKLNVSELVNTSGEGAKRVPAVAFTCDLLTAALACDAVRSTNRRLGEPPARIWVFRQTWSPVPGNAVFTLDDGGKAVLNPDVFRIELAPVALVAPQASALPLTERMKRMLGR